MSETGEAPRGSIFRCDYCGQPFDNQEKLNSHISFLHSEKKSSLDLRTQYDRLAEDWRQVHSVVWGIPSVAIAIFTGIVFAAYQPEMEGWQRIIVLSVGSVLLFGLTVEIIEKRMFMNAISAKMYFLEKSTPLDPFNIRKRDVIKILDKYNDEMKRKPDADLPYRLFKWSHARAGLAYVVFLSAILVTALSYWEFVKFLDYTAFSYLLGIIPIIGASIMIAVIRLHDSKQEKS